MITRYDFSLLLVTTGSQDLEATILRHRVPTLQNYNYRQILHGKIAPTTMPTAKDQHGMVKLCFSVHMLKTSSSSPTTNFLNIPTVRHMPQCTKSLSGQHSIRSPLPPPFNLHKISLSYEEDIGKHTVITSNRSHKQS